MGEAKEIRISEYEHHPSLQINGYPRDLMQRFREGAILGTKNTEEEDEEIELNLGLSLGSLFGVKTTKNRLVRSSSIAGLATLFREEEDASLIRTCSLPAEAEEDRRKRKEIQSLRRLEAKRKRSEKQRNCRVKDRASLDEEDKREEEGLIVNKGLKQEDESTGTAILVQQQQYMVSDGVSSSMVHLFRPPNWASPSSKVTPAAQGSISSGTSEIEVRPVHQGLSSCTEARSPKSVQSLLKQNEHKAIVAPTTTTPQKSEKSSMSTGVEPENTLNKPRVPDSGSREMGMKIMEEMPSCWTTGSGSNGKRIQGLLYNYRKGEEVRIVCVCHGRFLTPAEFVKHAGGGDVENPLRHITVNPSSSSSIQ